ncbi:regulatory protein YcgZ [Pantoea ananatis]|uniref:regulatory protein YcgZ n=1 Tax=Pantoea ananas TaxID=553 RepID=UPI001B301623|nr:regulatory protein YcgZ [Pantoea ananatis]
MQHNPRLPQSADDISRYFSAANLPSQQELLGQIVVDILRAGQNVNRKSICTKLLRRLELSASQEEERLCRELIGLLFGR